MKHILAAILLVALLTATGQAQDKVYRYEKGKDYKYLLEETMMQIQEVQGQTITNNTESTVGATISIADVSDEGNMSATVKIDNALILVESANGTESFGNDLSGKSVAYTFDHLGDVVDVDTNSTKDLDGQAASVLMKLSEILPKLDPSKLSVGSTWTVAKIDTAGEGENMRISESEAKYTVNGKKQIKGFDCLEIAMTMEGEMEGTMVRGDSEMSISGTQQASGTIQYAPAEGILVSFKLESTGDQVVVVAAMNMRVPITSTSTMSVELVTK